MISGTKIPREKRIQIIYSTYTEFSFHEIPREKEKNKPACNWIKCLKEAQIMTDSNLNGWF
jgi:hypothetical protein